MDTKGREDISTSHFQQKIIDWFERKGMLSELRSHLRHQMITAFQNSSMGNQNLTGRFTVDTPISPVLQAFLLLVAEFLAQQEYHYTVSILVAEVPLLATFPKFSAHVSHLSDSQLNVPNRDLPRYSEKDVVEILETLGIPQNSESSYHILRLYMDSTPRESLLACVLTALPAVLNGLHRNCSDSACDRNPENLTFYVEEIRLLLLRAQLDRKQLHQLEDVLRRFHACASAKARQEERALCLKEAETTNQQLRNWENAARQRQRDVEVELENSKRKLKAVSAQLCAQQDEVLRRLRRVQKHAEEVRIKEDKVEAAQYENEQLRKNLESRNEHLVGQEARLEEGLRSLKKDRDTFLATYAEIQQREKVYLSSNEEQKNICANLQSELEKTRIELNEVRMQLKATVTQAKIQPMDEPCHSAKKEVISRSTQTDVEEPRSSSSSVVEPVLSSSSSEADPAQSQPVTKKAGDRNIGLGTVNIVRHLRQENAELQERNVQLQRRLEEVTEQAAIWAASPSRRIEPAVLPRPSVPPPPPPPPPLPPPHLRKVARSCELGAGEELSHPPARPASSSREHTVHLHGREWKRSAPKQLLVHVEPSEYPSSDESVSEEVLRETGRRLRHLDAESQLIDRRRKELKESSLTSTGSYMFIPTATTPTLPPPPAVRSYEPGSISTRLSLFPSERISSSVSFGLHDSTLGRYSQVTWPDVQGTSTPIRSYDNPLRRGVRSHLSLSRERRSTVASADSMRDSEERVPIRSDASPLRSTEKNAFFRLDAALDNIKLIREDLKWSAEKHETKPIQETKAIDEMKDRNTPITSVPYEETNALHPSELDSPSRIRDRVMATLKASTLSVAGLSTVPTPTAVTSQTARPSLVTSQQFSMPAQQTLVTAQRSLDRVQSSSLPAQQSLLTAHELSLTAQQTSTPAQQTSIIAQQTSTPAQQTLVTTQWSLDRVQSSSLPAQQSLLTAHELSLTAQQTSTPAQQTSTPAQQTSIIAQQTSTPAQQITTPAQQTTTPAQQTTTPAQQTLVTTQWSLDHIQSSSLPAQQSLLTAYELSLTAQQTSTPAQQTSIVAQQTSTTVQQTPASAQQTSVVAQQSSVTALIERGSVDSPVQSPVKVSGQESRPEVSLPYRISSSAIPNLPLAPTVSSEKTDESPKDSTLHEIPTPATSPSRSERVDSLRKIVGKAHVEEVEEVEAKLKSNNSSSEKELNFARDVEPFVSVSVHTLHYSYNDDERILAQRSSSSHSEISAGTVDDLKDDSW